MHNKWLGVSVQVAESGVLHDGCTCNRLTRNDVSCDHTVRTCSPDAKNPWRAEGATRDSLMVQDLALSGDFHNDVDVHLGVQVHGHGVATGRLDVRLGQSHRALVEARAAGLLDRHGDVAGGHRTEQLA